MNLFTSTLTDDVLLDVPTNLDIPLFLGTELTKMMIRMTVTEPAPFRCRQGAKQRMVS